MVSKHKVFHTPMGHVAMCLACIMLTTLQNLQNTVLGRSKASDSFATVAETLSALSSLTFAHSQLFSVAGASAAFAVERDDALAWFPDILYSHMLGACAPGSYNHSHDLQCCASCSVAAGMRTVGWAAQRTSQVAPCLLRASMWDAVRISPPVL